MATRSGKTSTKKAKSAETPKAVQAAAAASVQPVKTADTGGSGSANRGTGSPRWRWIVYALALFAAWQILAAGYQRGAGLVRDWKAFRAWQEEHSGGGNDGTVNPDRQDLSLEAWIAAGLPASASADERSAAAGVFETVAGMLDDGRLRGRADAMAETVARLQPEVRPLVWNPFLTALSVRAAKETGGGSPGEIAEVWRRIARAISAKKTRAAELFAELCAAAPKVTEEAPANDAAAEEPAGEEPQEQKNTEECPGGNCPRNAGYGYPYYYSGGWYGW